MWRSARRREDAAHKSVSQANDAGLLPALDVATAAIAYVDADIDSGAATLRNCSFTGPWTLGFFPLHPDAVSSDRLVSF